MEDGHERVEIIDEGAVEFIEALRDLQSPQPFDRHPGEMASLLGQVRPGDIELPERFTSTDGSGRRVVHPVKLSPGLRAALQEKIESLQCVYMDGARPLSERNRANELVQRLFTVAGYSGSVSGSHLIADSGDRVVNPGDHRWGSMGSGPSYGRYSPKGLHYRRDDPRSGRLGDITDGQGGGE